MSDTKDADDRGSRPEGQDGGEAGESSHASFVERLRLRVGREVDPGISLQDEDEGVHPEDSGDRDRGGERAGGGSPDDSASTHGSSRQRLITKLSGSIALERRYRVSEEIARGGMGTILRVWDDDLRRNLAMKVMHGVARVGTSSRSSGPEEERLMRFLEEAQITGQLDHPGIVPVHDLGIDARGRCYFTMRLVRGRELKEVLLLARERREGWTLTRALGIVLKVCEAMAFAHSKSVVHRDLKPSNVMVGRFGETYVMDWGLARVVGREPNVAEQVQDSGLLSIVKTDRRDMEAEDPESPLVTLDGDVVGTPSYMAPEQARGDLASVGPRSDVYSLGAILYYLLTGRAPYLEPGERISAHAVLSRVLGGPPVPVERLAGDVPAELVAICKKAMAREPENRYASMLAVADDIQAFLENRVVRAYEGGAVAEIRKWVARNRGVAASTAALIVLALGSAAGFAWQKARQVELLEKQRAETDVARKDAQDNLRLALAREKEAAAAAKHARESAEKATASEERARRSGYRANLIAAESSLRLEDVDGARARLDACDEDMRGWEWRNLALEAAPYLHAYHQRASSFDAIALLGDGHRVAVLTGTGLLDVLDASTLEPSRDAPLRVTEISSFLDAVRDGRSLQLDWETRASMAVSPATGEVATYVRGDAIVLVDVDTDARRQIPIDDPRAESAEATPAIRVLTRRVRCLAFSPDGTLLAAGTSRGAVLVWNAADGALVATLEKAHQDAVLGLAWNPDGSRLASGGRDGGVVVWRTGDWKQLGFGREHEGAVTGIAYEPHRGSFVSCGRDGAIFRWEPASGRFEGTVARIDAHLESIAVRGQSGELAVVEDKGEREASTVHVVHAPTSSPAVLGILLPVLAVERVETHRLPGATGRLNAVVFLPDDEGVVAGGVDGTVREWDVEGSLARTELPPPGSPVPTGLDTAFASDWREIGDSVDHEGDFSPDGKLLATAGASRYVMLWDAETGFAVGRLQGHEGFVQDVAFSSDGKLLASSSIDKTVRLWDVAGRSPVRILKGHEAYVGTVLFGAGDSLLYTGSGDRTVRVWDVTSGQTVRVLEGHRTSVGPLALAPDGKVLASGGRDVLLWDTASGDLLGRFEGYSGRVRQLAFTADGKTVWAGYTNGALRQWSVPDGELVTELSDQEGPTLAMAVSPDGSRLFTGGVDRLLRVREAVDGEPLISLDMGQGLREICVDPSGERLAVTLESGRTVLLESGRRQERRADRAAERARRERLRPRVRALVEELGYPSEVERAIAADPQLDEADRTTARAILDAELDLPAYLSGRARALARPATSSPEDRAQALRMARTACELDPADPFFRAVRGVCEVRSGNGAAALEDLSGLLDRTDARLSGSGRLDLLLFLALACDETELDEQARARLDQAHQMVAQNPTMGRLPGIAELFDEVEAGLSQG